MPVVVITLAIAAFGLLGTILGVVIRASNRVVEVRTVGVENKDRLIRVENKTTEANGRLAKVETRLEDHIDMPHIRSETWTAARRQRETGHR